MKKTSRVDLVEPVEKMTAFLHLRCFPEDKAKWIAAAKAHRPRMKLTPWAVQTLNAAATVKSGRNGHK